MSSTVYLLDDYRFPILSNKNALTLLALLLREGAKTQEELAANSKIPSAALRSLARDLFHAGLVRLVEGDTLSLTDKGAAILDRLGLLGLMVDSVVTSYSLPDEPGVGLKRLLSSGRSAMQKSLRLRVVDRLAKAWARDPNEASRFLLASVLAMHDQDAPIRSPEHSSIPLLHFSGHGHAWENLWLRASSDLDDAKAFCSHWRLPAAEDKKRVVQFILFETCASALAQVDRPSMWLHKACVEDGSLPSRLTEHMIAWVPNADALLTQLAHRYQPEYLQFQLAFQKEAVWDALCEVLRAQLGDDDSTPVTMRNLIGDLLEGPLDGPERVELALLRISELRHEIETGSLRSLSVQDCQRLEEEVAKLAESLSSKRSTPSHDDE